MKFQVARVAIVAIAFALVFAAVRGFSDKQPPHQRQFEFTYSVTVKNLSPEDDDVRVWIPVAVTDNNQRVVLKNVSAPVPTKMTRDGEFGNKILFADLKRPHDSSATFTLDYEVTRKEYSRGDFAQLDHAETMPQREPPAVKRFLLPDRLVPIDGKMKLLADENTKPQESPVEKAHSIYDYVFKTLKYDKSGTGWGRGDSLWACDSKHGNCTDFHSLFISMMRAEGIPARFEIGFPLPESAHEGEIPGYHCWAEFYVNGLGWVPVDISEAWKNPAKHDYFFGTLDPNRVQFTIGRDLTLAPPQAGPPLNYFVYPYVEVDGKPHEAIDKKFAFHEGA